MWKFVFKVVFLWRTFQCGLDSTWHYYGIYVFFGVFFCSPQISVKHLVYKIQSPQEWEALQALTVCIDLIFLLFYSTIMCCTKVPKSGFMQALCRCRFLRLAWRTAGEDFTMKSENLGFWMSWLKSFHPKYVTNQLTLTECLNWCLVSLECWLTSFVVV